MKNLVLIALTLVVYTISSASAQLCLADKDRVDCHPEPFASHEKCIQRGCTWCEPTGTVENTPKCYIPTNYGYKFVSKTNRDDGFLVQLDRIATETLYGSDSPKLTMNVTYDSDYRLHIKFTDGTPRYEVPLTIAEAPAPPSENPLYRVEVTETPDTPFSFRVLRASSNVVLFDTSLGGFTFSDQFLQFTTKLPTTNLYGIGETEQHSFKHSFENYPNWPLFGRDQPPDGTANMYGVQPYYTVLETDGSAHSVAILNSNAQEFTILPTPGIQYRTIGGILDFYFFLGPTPEAVVQQYTEAVGRASLPPYWALGFQLCKYGYNNLETMKAAVDRTALAKIPHDVQYGDIDIMERELDFTVSADRFGGLAEYVNELKTKGIKFITILDPCISIGEEAGTYPPFDVAKDKDIWVKKAGGSPVIGKVWPADPVYFPDYTKDETRTWWIDQIKQLKSKLSFDALRIDMNEPANFVAGDLNEGCNVNKWNNPPYVPRIQGNYLPDKTLCMDHTDSVSTHYNTHSMYGWFESEPTLAGVKAATNNMKRGFILSRSTFLGSGKWAAHWLGDNWSKWTNLHYSIIGILQFNQFGVPFVGADICGFIGESNAALCQRWMELGAFYPFSRNHNGLGYVEQDPGSWGDAVAESSRKALEHRYTLIPYLYTLFYLHTTTGSTVARALWHEFPADPATYGVDRQFLWGSGLLITPVLDEAAVSVEAYIPDAKVYNYFTGASETARKQQVTIPTPLDVINLHVIGGNILPTQEHALNTQAARDNPMGLIVALDDEGKASGQLYYDAGDSPDPITTGEYFLGKYLAESGKLTATVDHNGYADMSNKVLTTIRLLGAGKVATIMVNGVAHTDFEVLSSGEVLVRNLNLVPNTGFTIEYTV